ncbi:hypothetical protein [Nitrosomonas sp.]|uniref:hypothetical protein n=1 Tax=Nitrosomonas sp. TaxID=42353 RepID=UPI0025E3DC9A|nr:hypothetical protein [Nitrosomonas sp.]
MSYIRFFLQAPVADSKIINARVDKSVAQRNTEQKPARNHPWMGMPIGKPANDERCTTLQQGKNRVKRISLLGFDTDFSC